MKYGERKLQGEEEHRKRERKRDRERKKGRDRQTDGKRTSKLDNKENRMTDTFERNIKYKKSDAGIDQGCLSVHLSFSFLAPI